jgi:hypothetical protein
LNIVIKAVAASAVAAALVLASVGSAGASSWGTVSRQTHTITTDLGAVSAAAGSGSETATQSACDDLGTDVAIAQASTRPHGYSRVSWRSYQTALTWFGMAASSCSAGDYSSATSEITTGAGYIKAATRALRGA